MKTDPYATEYLRGLGHFNARRFFEAHECWEAIWMHSANPDRLFYKGLIHAAVALHHFSNGNLVGARKVWGSCRRYLSPYAPSYLGLDVRSLLEQLGCCFHRLECEAAPPGAIRLDRSLIPHLVLDPPAHTAVHPSGSEA